MAPSTTKRSVWIFLFVSFPVVHTFAPNHNVHHCRASRNLMNNVRRPVWLRTPLLTATSDIIDGGSVATNGLSSQIANDSALNKQEIDAVLDRVCGTAKGNIIRPISPKRMWLWRRWRGTVLREILPTVAFNMIITLVLCLFIRKATHGTWAVGLKPDASHPAIARLAVFRHVWNYLMTLTTFVLTFFVGEAYVLWKRIYTIGRQVQGRLNDISILLATHAKRNQDSTYTTSSQKLMDTVARHERAFHVLMWANCARDYSVIRSPEGLNQMVDRNMLSRDEVEALKNLDLPITQRHIAILEWMLIEIQAARRQGIVEGGSGFEHVLLDKFCTLRATYATIGDVVDGRMPLAYAHMVQILVDGFLLCAPLALYAELGAFSVISVGLLTFFYSGLLDLAKVFLDPLDNEDYCQGCVKIDLSVLIRESNAGSVRWKNGVETLPPSLL